MDIELKGVKTNNLKDIDVKFPLGKLSVVTGVSGSGKSSLVFDSLYAESYRRYVESLSSFARQYLKALPRAEIEGVENLPASVSVKQARSSATSRSTVGTITEVIDLLRVIFVHTAEIICPGCGEKIFKSSPEKITERLYERFDGERIIISAPLEKWKKLNAKDLKTQLQVQGFSRIFYEGEMISIDEAPAAVLKKSHVVIDRIRLNSDRKRRVSEAIDLALKAGKGEVTIFTEGGKDTVNFLSTLSCPNCHKDFAEPSLVLFSFNHPYGACETCQGFGYEAVLDWDKIIPDQNESLATGGVAAWGFGEFAEMYKWAKTSAKRLGIDYAKSFKNYTASDWKWLKEGDGKNFPGMFEYFRWFESQRYKPHYRIFLYRYKKYTLCHECHGARLNECALSYRIDGENIAEVSAKSIDELSDWLKTYKSKHKIPKAAVSASEQAKAQLVSIGIKEALDELNARINYLRKIGVGYLTLDRLTRTLSGGELQRINMARCLGSALTDIMYCLDEPTVGLHARDSKNLLEILYELRDQGNSVIVVEHEKTIIDGADHLIEIGPKAGHLGGHVVYEGPAAETPSLEGIEKHKATKKQEAKQEFFYIKGASTNNLKSVDAKFPTASLIGVCGVSGSGKTSLIQHTLYPYLCKFYKQDPEGVVTEPIASEVGPKDVLRKYDQVILVSQAALGRSSRSNILTYLDLSDDIRKLMSSLPEAKSKGLTAGSFSFNTTGGRCENCKGLGTVVEDLSFLGEMSIVCPSCNGRRFSDAVLDVKYKGKNFVEILNLTVDEARVLFFDNNNIVKVLDTVIDMGLGYITLGQSTSSFSGGEAQRLKLLRLLLEAHSGKPSILIFDEPTTGLSNKDVANLIKQFRMLTDRKHTVIVVEHHLDVLKECDWLIEVGPEAADEGGELVFEGEPKDLKKVKKSITAKFI